MDKIRSTKVIAIALIFAVLFAIFPLTAARAETTGAMCGEYIIAIDDRDNCLTEAETNELVMGILSEASRSAGCNIGIVITSDLGGKTSKQFADDYADEVFGAGSDSVVLLLFNSYNKPEYADATDYISTSGKMRNKLDKYIDPMFDVIYNKMGEPQGDKYAYNEETHSYGGYDYLSACEAFAASVRLYAGKLVVIDGEEVDPGFNSGGGTTLVETKGFAEWLSEFFASLLKMLGGQWFGY